MAAVLGDHFSLFLRLDFLVVMEFVFSVRLANGNIK